MSDNAYPTPSKKLDLGEHTVTMPYAKLMDLCRMLPDPASTMSLIMSDPITQDYVVRRCMTPLDKVIKSNEDLIPAEEIELDSDQVEQLLTWVVQHILYFFAKRTQGLARAGSEFKQALPNLSSNGSENSISTEQPLGPSTS